jgi:hypothetical protein
MPSVVETQGNSWGKYGRLEVLMFLEKFAVACFVVGFICPALAEDCLPYEPATVALVGTLTMGHGYGPPGFGEDPKQDQKEEYGLLTLDKPACVSGGQKMSDDADVQQISSFQLIGRSQFPTQWVGTRVLVSGTLTHRVSGGHTDVMIQNTDVSRAP